jgi:exopolyphosphatase/guanosine-5'-triphosphate,3'-diphosphate pyrophosphatase
MTKRPAANRNNARVAVVDIGSNSIRLVVFDRISRAALPLFNEKVLCGLGRGLDARGRLDESGARLALDNLARFVRLARAMHVSRIDLLATAAVRDAANGAEFVAEIRRRCRVPVRVLSGEEEARLSALGVISGIPEADGFMGDLGGGSLEVVVLDHGKLGAHATLALGPVRLMDETIADRESARTIIDRHLGAVPWLDRMRGRNFYPVGGAWRSLARLHIEQTGYPLHVIHEYSINRRQAEDLVRVIGRLGRRTLASFAGVSKRRVETLPFAALVLERLLRIAMPNRIVFSAFGLREGHLFAQLPRAQRAADPLIVACSEIARAEGRFGNVGALLQAWIDPLFQDDNPTERRLRLAACTLSDIGWRDHPDYRAAQCFSRILRLPVPGIDHGGRISVALAIFARYGGEDEAAGMERLLGMLDDTARRHWFNVGLALRLAHAVSGATPNILRRTGLRLEDGRLALLLRRGDAMLNGEAVERRLDALGRALGASIGTDELQSRHDV